MKTRHFGFVSGPAIVLLLFGVPVDSFGQDVDETCLVEALANADDATTVGDLRVLCGVERAWYRIPEDDIDDDNSHEYRYYGYGDLRAIRTPKRNTFTAMLRPGTQESSYEVTWSYPISSVFRVYAQYYKGFGESMLDYDYDMERFGIGIAMNDFLGRY